MTQGREAVKEGGASLVDQEQAGGSDQSLMNVSADSKAGILISLSQKF
jgi:hypothetical protein